MSTRHSLLESSGRAGHCSGIANQILGAATCGADVSTTASDGGRRHVQEVELGILVPDRFSDQ